MREVHCCLDLWRFLYFFSSFSAWRMNSSSYLKEKSPGHTDRYKNNPTDNAWSIKNAACHTFSKNTRPQNKLKKKNCFIVTFMTLNPCWYEWLWVLLTCYNMSWCKMALIVIWLLRMFNGPYWPQCILESHRSFIIRFVYTVNK